ncbi:MAG TPA: glycoside hydrolase family 3 N-terminal domain-containing protein [Planctomycetota bacterium]|nr:glycoside hydrolase family 3 N-terminal domain-containing protein [Planctomycetota bacterium]
MSRRAIATAVLLLASCVSVETRVSRMSLAEKVGQLFVVAGDARFSNERSPEWLRVRRLVEGRRVGGIIWYRSSVFAAAQLDQRLQQSAPTPLLVSCDLEDGLGTRFDDASLAPPAMAIAATGDPDLAWRLGRSTAEQAHALGIHQIYAPVADVNVDPDNPVINVRSFGEDPHDVARYVAAYCRGVEAGGAIATLKHFPGHGDTKIDSHRSLPVLDVDRQRLDRVELVPFRAGIAAGARSVMVAHVAVSALDPRPAPILPPEKRGRAFAADARETQTKGTMPATCSAPMVEGLLRGELGFDGLVVTDAMNMGGLADHFEPGEGAVCAILAGVDQILVSPDPEAAIDAVVAAASSGRIPVARIDQSVGRVLREKERLGLFARRTETPSPAVVVDTPEHVALLEEIAARSLTLVREAPGALPLRKTATIVHVVVTDDVTPGPVAAFDRDLASRASVIATAILDPRSTPAESAAAIETARKADCVVLSLVARARSGSGVLALPERGASAASAIVALGKKVVAVSFGTPYLLRELPAIETYLAAYAATEPIQRNAAKALFGESPIGGRLPVSIPGLVPLGAGLRRG